MFEKVYHVLDIMRECSKYIHAKVHGWERGFFHTGDLGGGRDFFRLVYLNKIKHFRLGLGLGGGYQLFLEI